MAIVINSNISSLTAQRALGESQKMQSTAMERLSSGLRINSAKDDAAGLAIAENFTSQINGLNQAVRNANDAYSLAQTAEGGLQETTAILQRMRELAVQASNSTLTTADRTAIQAEVDALTSEIDRIAKTTQYNSSNILDGSGRNMSFQIGDKAGQTVGLALDSALAADLGLSGGSTAASGQLVGGSFSGTSPDAVDDVLINGVNFAAAGGLTAGVSKGADGVATATTIASGTAGALAAQINTNTSQHGVTATASTRVEGQAASGIVTGALTLAVTDTSGGNGGGTITIDASSSLDELISNINNTAYGVTAVKNSNDGLDLVSDTGNSIVIGGTVTGSGLVAGTYHGTVSLSSSDGSDISIAIGTNTSATITDVINMGFNVQTSPSTVSGGAIAHHAADDLAILADDDLTVNGVQIGTTRTDKTATTLNAADLAATINAVSAQTNVEASARTEVSIQVAMADATTSSAAANDTVTVNGVATGNLAANDSVANIAADINTAMQGAGIDIVATSSGSIITLVSESGANIAIADDDATNLLLNAVKPDGTNTDAAGNAITNVGTTASVFGGTLTLTNTTGGSISLGSANATDAVTRAKWAVFGLSTQGAADSSASGGVDLSSATKSSAAITAIDAALSSVNTIRGDLGALQNRLDYTISSLQNTVENHSASRSRVMDADFAVESANLAKSQVLAQASTAMLAQANAAPQLALQLLQ